MEDIAASNITYHKIEETMLLGSKSYITKTYLYNFDPLKPHFYIVKLGFTGVYIIFLIYTQNIDCVYSFEPPQPQSWPRKRVIGKQCKPRSDAASDQSFRCLQMV